ncbi:MAG: hypothetical protein EXR95_01090 [Gemmatimonadetes bacterium]|nr:hypothetical protein [Gemmatimonadota bacterium]
MAKTDEKVMLMVEQELAKNPEASVDELFDKAKRLNSGIARMTRRQFHARYPLQVKRRQGAGKRGRKGTKGKKAAAAKGVKTRGPGRARAAQGDGRDAVRQVLLRLAEQAASADTPSALVKLIVGVDRYVDDVMKVTGR